MFCELCFGRFKGQPLIVWIQENVLAKAPNWFEDNKAADALLCFDKINKNEYISSMLYRTALQQTINIRARVEDIETLSFCYELHSIIVESICKRLFKLVTMGPEKREEVKDYLALLGELRTDTQASQETCDTFSAELNELYEAHFSKPINLKEKVEPSADLLLPLEFSSYFLKSLSTQLLQTLKPMKWSGVTFEERKKPIIEACFEQQQLFKISALLMLAVFYLRLRIRVVRSAAEPKAEGFSLIPLNVSELSAVSVGQSENVG